MYLFTEYGKLQYFKNRTYRVRLVIVSCETEGSVWVALGQPNSWKFWIFDKVPKKFVKHMVKTWSKFSSFFSPKSQTFRPHETNIRSKNSKHSNVFFKIHSNFLQKWTSLDQICKALLQILAIVSHHSGFLFKDFIKRGPNIWYLENDWDF